MKNMKNWIAFLLVVIFTMSLAACSTKGTDNQGNISVQGEQESHVNDTKGTDNQGNISGNTESGDQGAFFSTDDSIYGKITSIIGNEIEIAIAKKPEDNEAGEDDLKGDVITPNENDMPVIGGEVIDDVTDNLELTGETKSLTIPAGVKISNMGQEISLSNLKKGDIISLVVDLDNPDTVVSVDKVK